MKLVANYNISALKKAIVLLCVLFHLLSAAQDVGRFTEAQYKTESALPKSLLSQHYSFIGMYREALKVHEENGLVIPFEIDTIKNHFHAVNAYPYIYNAIKKNRIVILNETHHIPQNRALFYTLIDSLKKFGVRDIFVETLSYSSSDSVFNYMETEDWGYYAVENVFHQTMLKIKHSGIRLRSYEESSNDIDTMTIQAQRYFVSHRDTKWIPIKADTFMLSRFFSEDSFFNREARQALKIAQKLDREEIGKAFIYCGYAHAWRQGGCMIDLLEHLLKSKIYSIDQTLMNECASRQFENPLYTKFATTDFPFVLLTTQNEPMRLLWSNNKKQQGKKLVDLVIASPRSVYAHNRPTWLELNGDRKRYSLSKFIRVSDYTDYLVAVYDPVELTRTKPEYIPQDIFQVFGNGNDYDLILIPNKEYEMRIIKDGKIVLQKPISTRE